MKCEAEWCDNEAAGPVDILEADESTTTVYMCQECVADMSWFQRDPQGWLAAHPQVTAWLDAWRPA